jgi:glycosyltransferase involved in cell wall biosynthesis
MRVLHIVPSFGFGGMEKIICAVIEGTANRHEHIVLPLDGCSRAAAWIPHVNVQLLQFAKSTSRHYFFQSLHTMVRTVRPHLLMTYNWGATDAIWLGRLAGIRHILHNEHGFNIEEGVTTVWKRDCIRFLVYRLSSRVIVVSHELQEMLRQRFLLSENKIQRIPNGIDTSYYSPDIGERQRVRKSLGFMDSDCVLGFSGRLDPVKNLDLLLNIFCKCRPHETPFRLLIVGDGPERQRLEAYCREKNFHQYVVFTGQQEQVLPYLRAMDVFLLTSLREQMPLTVLEAMAVGLPVISTRVGEVPYIIDEGEDGFIRDRKPLAEAFEQPLRSLLDSSRQRAMGLAARKKVLTRFQQNMMVKQYAQVIQGFE